MNDNSENIKKDNEKKVMDNTIKSITKKLLSSEIKYTREEVDNVPNPNKEEEREDVRFH